MSQGQPRRPVDQPIKYGDVFSVEGERAEKAMAPGDAALMQSAESLMLGKTQKGAAAAAMQSAASRNERAGFVGHYDIKYDLAGGDEQGISVTETDLPGRRIISESVCGQVLIPTIYYILN